MENGSLRHHGTKAAEADAGGDELRQPQENGRERQLRGAGDARGIVEELAEEKLHAARMRRRPLDEAPDEGVEAGGPRHVVVLFVERAFELDRELRADLGEHGRVELLLSREVVDDGRERYAGGICDVTHARAVEAGRGEESLGDANDLVAGARSLGRVAPEHVNNGTSVR